LEEHNHLIPFFIEEGDYTFNFLAFGIISTLEESLSITTGRCDLAIATHARKMHKNLFLVVHPEVLNID
jgi:hypothetical protein